MDEKERLALVDLDTILYIIAYTQFKNGNQDNPELVKVHIKEFISTILISTRADLVSMVYQDKNHNNFRKHFYPDYKATRPETPEFIKVWKDYILSVYKELGAVAVKVIESDDVLNIGYKSLEIYEIIIVSNDKDLNQIPGEHYNPVKNISFFITPFEAQKNLYTQIITGDRTDNILGLEGYGPKTAEKLLASCNNPLELEQIVHETYQKVYGNTWYSEYSKTKFLVSLLDDIDRAYYYFKEEDGVLFNIQKCSNLVVTNLFS